jgi:hypothetical protein
MAKADNVQSHITAVNIARDQNLFIQFNLRHFNPPPDWKFEVCTAYYDTVCITAALEYYIHIYLGNHQHGSSSQGILTEQT